MIRRKEILTTMSVVTVKRRKRIKRIKLIDDIKYGG